MASLLKKPTSSCLRFVGEMLLYYCCLNCFVYNIPMGFFYSYHLPCVFFHHRQQSNHSVLHFYRIQTYCSWLAPLLLQLPSLGEEKYTAVSAKHFRDAMFILKAFFWTKHWWLEFDRIHSFIHQFSLELVQLLNPPVFQ